MDFLRRLENERLVFDGAMGTMLQDELAPGELPELLNLKNPNKVLNIHNAYLRAGCHILKTNTFGANRLALSDSGFSVNQVVIEAVALAKKAAGGADAFVALDIGPTGRLLAPFGDLDFEEAVDIFSEMIRAGAQAGAGLVLIETMNDTYEIKAAMLAAKENCNLPLLVTFTPDSSGRLLNGADIQTAVCLIESLGACALGFNCGFGPEQLKSLLPELIRHSSIPIIVSPNAGMPERINGKTQYHLPPEGFASEMAELAGEAQIIGGCCGTSPEHIAAVVRACKNIAHSPVTQKNVTAVCSYGETVVFGGKTVIIGERLNPTGKPRMKKALYDGDMDFLYREGLEQVEHGAQILDVNVGLPDIDEEHLLARLVCGLQSVTRAALQIDTANAAAAKRALRLYNGKPLLNSVSGKKESLETILPLVKKYGAAVIALCLDDDGIPETIEGRIQIAEKIIAAAAARGIHKKNIIVDALTMTISTGGGNARITLDTVEYLRRKLGVHTVLGVSNVSFGLPGRENINAAFFSLAMRAGLSAGIVNPMNSAIMDAVYVYQALSGADENCAGYIARFSSQDQAFSAAPAALPAAKNAAQEVSLQDAIVRGLKEQAAKTANAMSADTPAMEIINAHLIPALDKAGKDFESQKTFLPQLLMSAEAAKAAFEALALRMSKQGGVQKKRGKIVLATVKGDVHDIGKNIVKILLENYNFQVIDLGKNVEPSLVLETVLKENITLAGLSALMTTTVVYMEETIKLLKEKAPNCRIMAGGAVLTESYANKIGADYYSKDAISAVRYAEETLLPAAKFEEK
ncbi:MAG: homocysteine S-methyltransferase family protein [Spirochaetaceae bacterium]|jgi:5-methyltetrahydrofolate--homocysteine methyltransferase|nr:homocysteine S-methyltransferase family protein [Spirochaetaceae bacterium]